MSEKTFKIVNGDISDGYHTFDELYEHRCLLFLVLAVGGDYAGQCYAVRDHYEDWDLVVWESDYGQISYHIPKKLREHWDGLIKEVAPDRHSFDGHTSSDVIGRLKSVLEGIMDDARCS